jgi:hypothetical protein
MRASVSLDKSASVMELRARLANRYRRFHARLLVLMIRQWLRNLLLRCGVYTRNAVLSRRIALQI